MAFPSFWISKFSGRACPQTPLGCGPCRPQNCHSCLLFQLLMPTSKHFDHVIHFGPGRNLEYYIPKCGRAGSGGEPSSCLTTLHSGLLGAHCMSDIKDYRSNTTDCRQTHLYSHFPGKFTAFVSGYQCCDICAVVGKKHGVSLLH